MATATAAYPSLTVPFQALYPHPAQMRTRYSVASLAELVCQIAARGLDPSQPIVVQPFDDEHDNYVAGDHPTATRPDPRYHIVSGHRRFYAACFARVIEAGGHEVTLEEAQRYFAGRIGDREYVTEDDLFGEIEALAAARYTIDIAVQVFDGNYEQGVLLLQASNFGAEEPDTLGIAHSLLAGQQIGISLSRAAQNIGQTEGYVRDLIAVAVLEDEAPALVRAIVDGKVSRSIARTIDTLNGEKRTAAIRFAEANLQSGIIVKDFEATIRKLRDFDGFRVPMVVDTNSQRNVARALANLWRSQYEADPVNAWHVAATMLHLGKSAEPYRMSRDIHDWMQAFGIPFTGLTASSGLLPPNALFWKIDDEDQPECGIFIEAHRRKLVIDDATAFTIPLPPLIFTGCKQKYRLFAVKARPMHGRERLYYPPLSNIFNSGTICKGNGELPDADWSTIDKAFELFMSAQFAPHLVRNRFKDYPNNVHEGWEKLALFGPDTFPLDQLVATQLTVSDII